VTSSWKRLLTYDLLQALTDHVDYSDPLFATITYIRLQGRTQGDAENVVEFERRLHLNAKK